MTHRTPDAGSAKVGVGALWIGIQLTAKNPKALSVERQGQGVQEQTWSAAAGFLCIDGRCI
jgi:hypothetical protein